MTQKLKNTCGYIKLVIVKNPIILYDYQKTRSGSCPKEFLSEFSEILQTDGYQGYSNVENVKRIYCLAHIRRKYFDIVSKLKDETLKNSRALIGFNFCEQLYKIEKGLKKDYEGSDDFYAKRYKTRFEKSAPIIEDFIKYVDVELKNALPKSPLGQALEYSQKFLPSFRTFLTDGSLEIDNNASERAMIVAELCQIICSEHRIPVLYTDLANPASNKAYKNVGFIECGKVSQILFDLRKGNF